MKKKITLTLALLSALAMVGCAGDNTSGSDDNKTSVVENVNDTIKFTQSDIEIERGKIKTIRVNTSALTTDDKTVMFSSEENGTYIQLATQESGDVSIKVKGLRIGKATLIATSVSDPSIKATVTINVVATKAALRSVWKGLMSSTNYTVTSYNPDVSEEDPTSLVKVTEDAVIAVDKDGKALMQQEFQTGTSASDEPITENMAFYGIGVSSDDLAYYLVQKSDGSWYTPAHSIQTSAGLLKGDSFLGKGTQASSFLEVSTFYGIQAINPTWFTNVKSEDNTYEIVGSDDDLNAAYAEALIWGLVDPVGKSTLLSTSFESGYTAAEAAALIDTTITVLNNKNVSITVTEIDSQITHVATLTDVGTTSLGEDVESYVKEGGKTVTKPTISSGLLEIANTFKKNDYSIYQNLTYGQYYDYYTPTYYWNGVTTEIAQKYKEWATKNGYTGDNTILTSGGFVVLPDGIYKFTLTENEGEDGNKADPTITIGERQVTSRDLPKAMGYFSTSSAFDTEGDEIYTFRTLSAGTGSTIYYSSSATVSDELSTAYFGGYSLKTLIDYWISNGQNFTWNDYGTSLQPTYSFDAEGNSYISKIQIGLGNFGQDGQNGYMFPANIVTDSCATTNPYDAQIKAAIANYKA